MLTLIPIGGLANRLRSIASGVALARDYGQTLHIYWFKDAGVRDLTVTLYPEGRHEMLNETNRQEVWDDVLSWLEKHL